MKQITITLTQEEMARLEEMAAKAALTPEEFSRLSFVRLLDSTASINDTSYMAAKSQVFEQYDDILHRLAK